MSAEQRARRRAARRGAAACAVRALGAPAVALKGLLDGVCCRSTSAGGPRRPADRTPVSSSSSPAAGGAYAQSAATDAPPGEPDFSRRALHSANGAPGAAVQLPRRASARLTPSSSCATLRVQGVRGRSVAAIGALKLATSCRSGLACTAATLNAFGVRGTSRNRCGRLLNRRLLCEGMQFRSRGGAGGCNSRRPAAPPAAAPPPTRPRTK